MRKKTIMVWYWFGKIGLQTQTRHSERAVRLEPPGRHRHKKVEYEVAIVQQKDCSPPNGHKGSFSHNVFMRVAPEV